MRTLLVGCSGGIGTAIARRLIEKGHDIVGVDRIEPHAEDSLSSFYSADLNDTDTLLSVCSKLQENPAAFWSIIYCAGVYPIVSFSEYTIPLWDEVHGVNARALFIICSRLVDMLENGGRVVTVVSGAAHGGSRDVGYSASKAALLGLTKGLAINLAERGILVNAVCPGPIVTPMSARMPPQRKGEYEERILLKRFGSPDEVAVAVEYLVDPQNTYMTGATIDVNGGLYLR